MNKLHGKSYLTDILDSAEQIIKFTCGKTLSEFENDELYPLAVARLFEIIGEATKRLSDDIRSANPEVPWKAIAGLRDVLIHQYHVANNARLFEIATIDLPKIIPILKKILNQFPPCQAP